MTQPAAEIIEKTARKISRLKLNSVAILLLEAHKPFSFVASQALLLGQPLLDMLLPPGLITEVAALLADRRQVDGLIHRLDALQQDGPQPPSQESDSPLWDNTNAKRESFTPPQPLPAGGEGLGEG
ncbi:MAG: hypothetical protein ACE5H9_06240 [Anaerolineae bacterium]